MSNIRFLGWLGIICLVAFFIIALFFNQITEHIPHSEDEVAYLFQAKVFALNRLAAPTPPNADAFWTPFVLDYQGQRFGKYPIGWPLLLSLGFRVGAPWVVNAVLAALTLGLIGWLGKCFYAPKIGLWAAALGLVTPGFLFLSGSFLSHAASLFWLTLALVILFYLTQPSRFQNILALAMGFCLGAAFITRPFAVLGIGLPLGIFLLTRIVRHKLPWLSLLWIAAGGFLIAIWSPLYWWLVTGDPAFNAYVLVWPYDRVGFGPDIGPQGFDLSAALFVNLRLKLWQLAVGLFGWPGWTSLIFIPIPFIARKFNRNGWAKWGRANPWDWVLLGTIGGIILVHIFYWAFGGVDGGFPRYYYDALPAFLLLTVRGISICYQYLQQWHWRHLQARWALMLLLVIFVAYNLAVKTPPLLTEQKNKYNITPAPLQIIQQAGLQEPALVMVKNATDWNNFAVHFFANSPLLDGPVVYAIYWNETLTQRVREQFKDRVCWELEGENLAHCP